MQSSGPPAIHSGRTNCITKFPYDAISAASTLYAPQYDAGDQHIFCSTKTYKAKPPTANTTPNKRDFTYLIESTIHRAQKYLTPEEATPRYSIIAGTSTELFCKRKEKSSKDL